MEMEAQAPQVYSNAISWCVGDASKGEIPDPLDRDSSRDAQESEDDEGAKIEKNHQAQKEGRVEQTHFRSWT